MHGCPVLRAYAPHLIFCFMRYLTDREFDLGQGEDHPYLALLLWTALPKLASAGQYLLGILRL